MNSLKHLGLPIMAVGAMEGPDELRWRDGDALRKVFLDGGRIVGFRFTGEIAGGGLLRSLLLRGDDVRRFGRRLVLPGFGRERDRPARDGALSPQATIGSPFGGRSARSDRAR